MNKKVLNPCNEAGSRESSEPRRVGSIVEEMLHSNEPLAVARRNLEAESKAAANVSSRQVKNSNASPTVVYPERFYPNTELAVDLKLLTHQPGRMPLKAYFDGVLRRDSEMHFTFIQTLSQTVKRNPHVFMGEYITVTRRDDGSFRPNFKAVTIDEDFCLDSYAIGVCNELRWALKGLIEEATE